MPVLDRIAASVGTGVSNEYATATLSVLKQDLELGLAIFADVLMNPEFREDRLNLEKAQLIEGIRRKNDDPHSIAFREFNKLLYGPKHPYGWEPTVESVGRISRQDLSRSTRTITIRTMWCSPSPATSAAPISSRV